MQLFTGISWRSLVLLCGVAFAILATGCQREEVKVYQVEKDKPAATPPANPHTASPHGAMGAMPKLAWQLPAGWTEQTPSAMRAASFLVTTPGGEAAEVSVIPLVGVTGRDLEMVNLWRSQVRLEPVQADEMERLMAKVPVGSGEGKLFDLVSKEPLPGQKAQLRVVVAMLDREATGWFFKMTGPDAVVASQRSAFLDFLKSVEFLPRGMPAPEMAGSPHAGMMMGGPSLAAGESAANSKKPEWSVPEGWQELPGGQFLVAKFALTGEAGAQAAVNISASGGDWASNVNRWRKQLGLSDLSVEEINQATTSLDVNGGKAMVVELSGKDARTGQPSRLVGAMVPQAGQAWFYKLMGDAPVVESQKAPFMKFVQSAKY